MSFFGSSLTVLIFIFTMLSTGLAVLSIAFPHIAVDIFPQRDTFGELGCEMKYYFYKVRTECNNQVINQTFNFPRQQGIFGCSQAYDRFMVAFAFSIIGCVLMGLSALVFAVSREATKISTRVTLHLTCYGFAALTVAWPISWSQTTSLECDRYLSNAVQQNAYIYDAGRGDGLNLLVAAWAFAFLAYVSCLAKWQEKVIVKVFDCIVVPNA